MKSKPSILFAGDSDNSGAARYLLGVMCAQKYEVTHVPPHKKLSLTSKAKPFDGIILSDYSYAQLSKAQEKILVAQVKAGSGLLMVGGWGSFSGPFGGWRGSQIEKLLPVSCRAKDDRLNFPSGAHMMHMGENHEILDKISFKNGPAIVGVNDVIAKKDSTVLLSAQKIISVGGNLAYDPVEHPLLVVSKSSKYKSAAFTCDFAPHWCGGMVDWGGRSKKLSVFGHGHVEVGRTYIDFVSGILRWLVKPAS